MHVAVLTATGRKLTRRRNIFYVRASDLSAPGRIGTSSVFKRSAGPYILRTWLGHLQGGEQAIEPAKFLVPGLVLLIVTRALRPSGVVMVFAKARGGDKTAAVPFVT